ncbi:Bgt-55033 [Blumeria graminis f. sp. tritici]|uniref:Bgt-55033 n=1 Tax=Blumeria graminis f. sp. tritici TaxID=62690 RepID=A0A9X9L6N9_BLUGR|nr:Bgt-55033 [Blumeria graminis f. sp. tritici]
MKIQKLSWLLTFLTASRIKCSYVVFHCGETEILDIHSKIA